MIKIQTYGSRYEREFLGPSAAVKEKTTIDAKVTMKHFEEAVKKVREQKDLKLGEKLVASYYR